MSEPRIKKYVEVIADFSPEGILTPQTVIWDTGQKFDITCISEVLPRKYSKTGGVGVRYLRKRYDAYDIDNDDKTQDDKERRLFARLIVLGGFTCGAAIASSVRGGLLGGIAVCLALLTLLVRALRSVCRTTLLTVARRDRTRRLNAAGVPARLLRIGNQLSSIVLRHRMHILRISPCGSSCFYWACIIAIT